LIWAAAIARARETIRATAQQDRQANKRKREAQAGYTRPLSGMNSYKNEDRMSATFARYRILAMVVVFSLSTILAGCSPYTGDPGAKRSQQQTEELRNRINTTQIDR
jgi:hypothetical protein